MGYLSQNLLWQNREVATAMPGHTARRGKEARRGEEEGSQRGEEDGSLGTKGRKTGVRGKKPGDDGYFNSLESSFIEETEGFSYLWDIKHETITDTYVLCEKQTSSAS